MKRKKYNIYLVDDKIENLRSINKKLLRGVKCETHIFDNAQSCLDRLKKEKPDLVFIDYHFATEGPLDSEQLVRQIKYVYKDLPVILYSSVNNMRLAGNLIKMGADHFIPADENLAEKVVRSTKKQIKLLKQRTEDKKAKAMMLLFISMIVFTFIFLHFELQNWLLYFGAGLLTMFAFIVFFSNPETDLDDLTTD